ncbi:MAG: hypothetical protein II534_07840 [Clostridia bacterium]|nr:hypothetical protein [Clostridia bacterium]
MKKHVSAAGGRAQRLLAALTALLLLLPLAAGCGGGAGAATASPVDTQAPAAGTTAAGDTSAVTETGEPVDTAPVTTAKPAVTTSPEVTTPASGDSHFRFTAPPSSFRFTQETVCTNTIDRSSYPAFFAGATSTGITVPALPQYFVPQGMDYWEEAEVFFISGYFNPTTYYSTSVLFAVELATGDYVGEWRILDKNGSPHTGHDGGVAVTGHDIWLATSSTLFRIPLDDVKATGGTGDLRITQEVSVPVRASYCNYSEDMLWVGEFSLQGNSSYTITGHDHGDNHAWTLGYRLGPDGTPESDPACVISTPEKIQGWTVLGDGRLFMTCSYGRRNNSKLYVSKTPLLSDANRDGTVRVGGKDIPLYVTGTLTGVTAPPMTEGCCVALGEPHILFESGAYYYRDYSSSKAKDPTDRIWKFSP